MTIGLPIRPHYGSAITGREQGLIAGLEMDFQEGEVINKEVTGASGAGNAAIAGCSQCRDPIHGNGSRSRANNLDVISLPQMGATNEGTIAFTFRAWDLPGAAGHYMVACFTATSVYYIYFWGNILSTWFGNIGAGQATTLTGLIGKSYRCLVRWSSTHVWVYVDGVLVDDYDTTFTDDISTLRIGAINAAGVSGFDGEIYDLLFYRRTVSEDAALKDYALYKNRAWYQETLRSVWVSSVDNIAGQLENSRWMIQSINGTAFRVVDAPELERLSRTPNVKAIECTGAGQIWIATQHLGLKGADPEAAYGTWEFWVRHADASETYIYIIADGTNPGTLNGYRLHLQSGERMYVRRYTAGGTTGGFSTALGYVPVDEWIRIRITRRFDGTFYVYMNDELVPVDSGSNPFVDNTHQVGSYFLADPDTGDAFGLLSQRWGEIL